MVYHKKENPPKWRVFVSSTFVLQAKPPMAIPLMFWAKGCDDCNCLFHKCIIYDKWLKVKAFGVDCKQDLYRQWFVYDHSLGSFGIGPNSQAWILWLHFCPVCPSCHIWWHVAWCLLDIHIQRLSRQKGLQEKPAEAGSGDFCYEVFPTLVAFIRPQCETVSRLLLLFLLD